jgi:hypothetical protein
MQNGWTPSLYDYSSQVAAKDGDERAVGVDGGLVGWQWLVDYLPNSVHSLQ